MRRAISVVAAIVFMLAGLAGVLFWLDAGGRALFLIAGTTMLITGFYLVKDAIQYPRRHPDL